MVGDHEMIVLLTQIFTEDCDIDVIVVNASQVTRWNTAGCNFTSGIPSEIGLFFNLQEIGKFLFLSVEFLVN